ncbi:MULTISPECIES: glycosyltransferase family 2 protein [Sutcliffiella]|uniref:Glycosyl transferase n=1 Tax=Sutcliffiella cohnii TaxID=33932 RepID=A0A223KVJ2_9BACI|nr:MULTISPECIES: glycosyltransferase family 2 protein [Sutcliffiella]AST93383.1 glycosyl transferase [Sutcliffiella cohnii]WBL14549.1 glycosyltransferase family 2 protein [Sutcliffiella sp. NC1]
MLGNTNNNPLISIVTPAYNSEAYIKDAIDSVLKQTYVNWEMIIVDDCSKDKTVEMVRQYSDPRIKLVQLSKNSGPAVARNTAMENARGRYLAFLDSDDQWLPEKLEKQLLHMQENDIAFSFTKYMKVDEDGKDIGTIVEAPDTLSYKRLLKDNVIGCLTVMVDKEKVGNLKMENIRTRQDWVLWLTILKKGFQAHGLQEVLAKYRERPNSVSSNKLKMAKQNWKVYREIEGFGLVKSIIIFIIHLFHKAKRIL